MLDPDLRAFLQSWLNWAENGAPKNEPYYRYWGLCSNVRLYPGYNYSIENELKDLLREDFGNSEWPFGEMDYDLRAEKGTQHECPERLAWVRKKLADA